MRRWIVVVAVLSLFLGAMAVSAVAQQVLMNYSKSGNAAGGLGLVEGDECQKVIKKLREEGYKQEKTAKSFAAGSFLFDGLSYTFVGPNKAVVLIDCAAS